jgi:small GTP-binding protein
MAVIGKGVVGKSSLTYRFINYKVPQGHDPTIEDRYKTSTTIKEHLYNIEILDTAGEDDYQNIMDMWINFGEGFLLVFAINDKESFELIKNKRDRILKGKHGESTPMVLVGNKFDLASERQVTYEEAKNLAAGWGIEYIETSAKTNHNVKEAFNSLALKINELKSKKGGCCCSIF